MNSHVVYYADGIVEVARNVGPFRKGELLAHVQGVGLHAADGVLCVVSLNDRCLLAVPTVEWLQCGDRREPASITLKPLNGSPLIRVGDDDEFRIMGEFCGKVELDAEYQRRTAALVVRRAPRLLLIP